MMNAVFDSIENLFCFSLREWLIIIYKWVIYVKIYQDRNKNALNILGIKLRCETILKIVLFEVKSIA